MPKSLKYILRVKMDERLFPNMCLKIDIAGLPEMFGNGGDSGISHLDNGAGNKCPCSTGMGTRRQRWGKGTLRAFCCVPRLCILFSALKERTVLVFCNKQDIVWVLFQQSIIKVVLCFVLRLIEGSSKVQSTTCRCYRDTKVQDKVLPTTGRLF